MQRVIPFDSVKELILSGGFGTYKLFDQYTGELVAGAHLNANVVKEKETGQAMEGEVLILDLEKKLDMLGPGNYRIVCKKNTLSNGNGEVTYRFQMGKVAEQPQPQMSGLGAVKVEDMEALVSRRVNEMMEAERQKQAVKDQMAELQWQLKELKQRKAGGGTRKKGENWMKQLTGMGMMVAATVISERYPNSVKLVEKVIDKISLDDFDDDEDEDDEKKETGFDRPKE